MQATFHLKLAPNFKPEIAVFIFAHMRNRLASKMDDLQALSYFSSLTHISRKIASQEKSLIKYLGNKWTEYSPEHQEEILDDLCVPHFIRDDHQPTVADDEDDGTSSCWPTLKLPSGEKIIVDENDVRVLLGLLYSGFSITFV